MSEVCTSTRTGGVECENKSKSESSKGVLIGVPIGVALVVILSLLGFLFFNKNRKGY